MNNDQLQQIEDEGRTFAKKLLDAGVAADEAYISAGAIATRRSKCAEFVNVGARFITANEFRACAQGRVRAGDRKYAEFHAFMAGSARAIEGT
jgi:hypothetical protein